MFSQKPIFVSDKDIFNSVKLLNKITPSEKRSNNIVNKKIEEIGLIQNIPAEIKIDIFATVLNKYPGSDIKWIV